MSGSGIKGFWYSEKVCLFGQKPESGHQAETVQCLCSVCVAVWLRVLVLFKKAREEDELLPPQVRSDHSRDLQPAAVV